MSASETVSPPPGVPFTSSARRGRVLTAADEVRLSRRVAQGDRHAREQMIECNLRLVASVVRPFRGCGVPYADLVQEGTVGLVQAVDRFDHRRGWKFSTYAVWLIRRAVLDAIAAGRVIRIPAEASRQLAAVRCAEAGLARDGSRRSSDAAIAERTGISCASVRSLRQSAWVAASLDTPSGPDSVILSDVLADRSERDVADGVLAEARSAELAKVLRLLPDRHRGVLIQRYGLDGSAIRTHRDIGCRLGIGEERVRQIESEALRRLRSVMKAGAVSDWL